MLEGGLMKKTDSENIIPFILSVTAFHVITYFIAGIIASSVFNYKQLFALPIIAGNNLIFINESKKEKR